jgi:hypothetical protein
VGDCLDMLRRVQLKLLGSSTGFAALIMQMKLRINNCVKLVSFIKCIELETASRGGGYRMFMLLLQIVSSKFKPFPTSFPKK